MYLVVRYVTPEGNVNSHVKGFALETTWPSSNLFSCAAKVRAVAWPLETVNRARPTFLLFWKWMRVNINFAQVCILQRSAGYETSRMFWRLDYHMTSGVRGNPILVKTVALRNTGHVKVIINDISFGSSKCSGQGFSVLVCSNIEIEPNEHYDLTFR